MQTQNFSNAAIHSVLLPEVTDLLEVVKKMNFHVTEKIVAENFNYKGFHLHPHIQNNRLLDTSLLLIVLVTIFLWLPCLTVLLLWTLHYFLLQVG